MRSDVSDIRIGDTVDTRYGVGIVTDLTVRSIEVYLRNAKKMITLKPWDVRRSTRGGAAGRRTMPAETRDRRLPTKSVGRGDTSPDLGQRRSPATEPASEATRHVNHLSARRPLTRATRTSEATTPFRPPESVLLRQAVEALRFGLVPTARLERLTVGYNALKSWILELLPDDRAGRPVAAEISGPFGTGKSHACAVVRHVAREKNYAVANVEVDGQRVTLANPGLLLNGIARTLHARDLISSTPIVELYLRAIAASTSPLKTTRAWDDRARSNFEFVRLANSRRAFPAIAHVAEKILSCSPNYTVGQAKDEIAMDRVMCAGAVTLRPPIGRALVERPAAFVQSLIAIALAAHIAGYGGLVITIDEFEIERNLQPRELERVAALIRELTGFIAGRTDHELAPIAMFFASVGQDGHAGDAIIGQLIDAGSGMCHELVPLSTTDRVKLAHEAYKLYAEAYGLADELDERYIMEVGESLAESGIADDSGVTRAFIKEFIARLDRAFGPPASRAAA